MRLFNLYPMYLQQLLIDPHIIMDSFTEMQNSHFQSFGAKAVGNTQYPRPLCSEPSDTSGATEVRRDLEKVDRNNHEACIDSEQCHRLHHDRNA